MVYQQTWYTKVTSETSIQCRRDLHNPLSPVAKNNLDKNFGYRIVWRRLFCNGRVTSKVAGFRAILEMLTKHTSRGPCEMSGCAGLSDGIPAGPQAVRRFEANSLTVSPQSEASLGVSVDHLEILKTRLIYPHTAFSRICHTLCVETCGEFTKDPRTAYRCTTCWGHKGVTSLGVKHRSINNRHLSRKLSIGRAAKCCRVAERVACRGKVRRSAMRCQPVTRHLAHRL